MNQHSLKLFPLDKQTGHVCRRAFAAFVKTDMRENMSPSRTPDYSRTRLFILDGKSYVALRSSNELVAVYRFTNRGLLKRLRRYPYPKDDLQLLLDEGVVADVECMINQIEREAA